MITQVKEDTVKTEVNRKKKILNKVLSQIGQTDHISDITEKELLKICNISEESYFDALETVQKRLSLLYRQRPGEVNIGIWS